MVKEGDFVAEDQEVLQFDSDKGSTAQRVPVSGKITKLLVKQDQEIPVPYNFIEIDTDQKGVN